MSADGISKCICNYPAIIIAVGKNGQKGAVAAVWTDKRGIDGKATVDAILKHHVIFFYVSERTTLRQASVIILKMLQGSSSQIPSLQSPRDCNQPAPK